MSAEKQEKQEKNNEFNFDCFSNSFIRALTRVVLEAYLGMEY